MTATFVGMPVFPTAARAALADTQLRRNLAHATSTIRARLPSAPEASPTTRTRSPTTTPLRPRGLDFIASTRVPACLAASTIR